MTKSTISAEALGVLCAHHLRATFDDDGRRYADEYSIFEVSSVGIGPKTSLLPAKAFIGEEPETSFSYGVEYGIALAAAVISNPLGFEIEDAIRTIAEHMRETLECAAEHRDKDRIEFDTKRLKEFERIVREAQERERAS